MDEKNKIDSFSNKIKEIEPSDIIYNNETHSFDGGETYSEENIVTTYNSKELNDLIDKTVNQTHYNFMVECNHTTGSSWFWKTYYFYDNFIIENRSDEGSNLGDYSAKSEYKRYYYFDEKINLSLLIYPKNEIINASTHSVKLSSLNGVELNHKDDVFIEASIDQLLEKANIKKEVEIHIEDYNKNNTLKEENQ